jgi:predicted AlkP superfamily phosphohydrolase/phosphomutase
MASPKLTVLGWDAATFDIIDPLIEAGQLPNLRRLFESGSRGVLRSTTPPITSQAWATAFTGVNAGRHGLWEFVERYDSGYRLRLVNGSFRRAPAVWDYLSAAGHRVGVVNVPFTWPASELNGFMVSGFDAAGVELGMVRPESVMKELKSHFGELELDHRPPLLADGSLDTEQVRRAAEQKVDITLWLAERFDPELLVVVFMAADHCSHYGWRDWAEKGAESSLAEVYRILDEASGRLLDGLGSAGDVLVLSDHGSGSLDGVINLNAWFAQEGFLHFAPVASARQSGELARSALFKMIEARARLPQGLRNFVKRRAPGLRDRLHELKEFTAIDWTKTKAFAYGYMGSVVLNVAGRERDGIVQPGDDYDQVCTEITQRLLELRDPEKGEPIVTAVHRRDALFRGPEIEKVPDLIVDFAGDAWAGKANLRDRTPPVWDTLAPSGIPLQGAHRSEGIVALSGPSTRTGTAISASIEDIASTILYLSGAPVPLDLEGRVLEEALDPALLTDRPPEYSEAGAVEIQGAQSYSADEAAEVEDRLRDLGYVE